MGEQRYTTRGFTLVELILGAGILIIALCAILQAMIGFTILAETSRHKTIAINDAQRVMEQIQDTAFSGITSTDWTNWAGENGLNSLDNEEIRVAFKYPESPNTDLLHITVTVNWKTRNRPLSIHLDTFRSGT